MEHSGLWTVAQTARALFRSEQGVRRLVKTGKLDAVKGGRKLLVKEESIHAYVEKLPHPPQLVSLLLEAQNFVGNLKSYEQVLGLDAWRSRPDLPLTFTNPQHAYWRRLEPLYDAAKAAIRAKQYGKAEEIRHQLWREYIDYEMLHRPVRQGEARKPIEKPQWAMDMLFTDEELGQV